MAPGITDTSLSDTASLLRTAIVRTSRALRQDAATETGLGASTTAALASINRDGPLTPSELADLERVKRPSMTRTLACLDREGLIERTPDPADGRSSLVSISAAGRERLALLRRRKRAYLARRLAQIDPAEEGARAR